MNVFIKHVTNDKIVTKGVPWASVVEFAVFTYFASNGH